MVGIIKVSKIGEIDKDRRIFKFKNKYLYAIIIVVTILMFTSFDLDNQGVRLYFVDVGQGDCTIIRDHNVTFMIDGGGDRFMNEGNNIGKRIVFPVLLELNIKKLDCVFVTHVHYDHIKGVLEVIEMIEVDTLVLPQVYEVIVKQYINDHYDPVVAEQDNDYRKSENSDNNNEEGDLEADGEDYLSHLFKGGDELFLLNELVDLVLMNDIELVFMSEGDVITSDHLSFECLYPYENKRYSDVENENSLVLNLEVNNCSVLFTGDVEEENELWIVNNKDIKNIDILKVPHHGSNTSSSEEFLVKLNPKVAIVSVGDNLFGHPSDIVKIRYKNLNIPFYSTKKYGMIEVIIGDNDYNIVPYKGELTNESIKRTTKD